MLAVATGNQNPLQSPGLWEVAIYNTLKLKWREPHELRYRKYVEPADYSLKDAVLFALGIAFRSMILYNLNKRGCW